MDQNGFLTVAFGIEKYIRMGKALARSMRRYSLKSPLAVVTDSDDPELRELFDIIIPLNPDFGKGVAQKLHLDLYSPFAKTLFIDSDCLLYGNPEELWDIYRDADGFGVIGYQYIDATGTHYSVGDISQFLARYGVERLPNFNGGIYYFDSSPTAVGVFEKSRQIYAERENSGLLSFKTSPVNDEPVIGLAMEMCGIPILPWDNALAMSTALGSLAGELRIDVLRGVSRFMKNGIDIEPLVIHYNVECQDYFIYRRELYRLELGEGRVAELRANIFAFTETFPAKMRFIVRQQMRFFKRQVSGFIKSGGS